MLHISNRAIVLGAAMLACMLMAPGDARAAVIYTNLGPGMSYDQSLGLVVGNGFDGSNYGEGSSFKAPGSFALDVLRIALSCWVTCPAAGPVTVALTANSSNQPGLVLESFTVPGASLGPLGANNAPRVLTSVLHPLLVGGLSYWVTVKDNPNETIAWNLNSTGDTSNEAISADGGQTWFSPSGLTPGAFQVEGTVVPEPVTPAMLLGGALLMTILRKRSRSGRRQV